MKQLVTVIISILLIVPCTGQTPNNVGDSLPKSPDYADTTQWYVSNRKAAADVFYIISTETGDYPGIDGSPQHFADTYADSLRQPMLSEMVGVDTLISGRLNYYSPYYRQCSLQTFLDAKTEAARMPVAIGDVRRAFKHYLQSMNGGRPFVLAGFSQGAMIMLELLKEMDADTYRRMVAAYAIGIAIPRRTLDACKYIVPAKDADDTGVTICYNSVRDAQAVMKGWERSAVAINPVNWRTDGTPATLVTETSPLVPVDRQKADTMTVSLDRATGLLFVSGFTGTDYQLPLIGREGNYHSREIWLYRHQLRDNMARRVANFLR